MAIRVPGYIVGATVRGGGGLYGSSLGRGNPFVTGYRLHERGGVISGFVIGGLFALLGATAASMPDSVNSQSTSYTRTNASGQRETVTETTTTATYNDPEGRQRALDASQDAAKDLMAYRAQAFELDVYTRDWFGSGLGDARGYRANFLLTAYANKRLSFEAGFGFGSVSAIVRGKDIVVDEEYIGIPLRLIVPWGPFYAQASLDLNFRGLDFGLLADDEIEMRKVDGRDMRVDPVRPMPFAISIHAMLWRLALSVGMETARPWTGQFGYVASAGARF